MLIGIREIADSMGPAHPLGQEIIDSAQSQSLAVRPNARLLIFEPDERAWPKHEKKLRDAGVDLHVADMTAKLVWDGRS